LFLSPYLSISIFHTAFESRISEKQILRRKKLKEGVEDRYIWLPLQHKFSLLHKKVKKKRGKSRKLVTPVF
jgi:hypothetical protein